MKQNHWKALLVSLMVVLGACGGGGGDAIFNPNNTFGGPIPIEATVVGPEDFKKITQSEDFSWDSLKLRADNKAKAQTQFKQDEAALKQLAAQYPAYNKALADPDPSVKVLKDGNYLFSVSGKSGPIQVVTDGKRALYRDLLESKKRFQDPANQLRVYRYGYTALPDNLRGGLPTPDSLSSAGFEAILEARRQLGQKLASNPVSDARAMVPGLSLQAVPPNAKPPAYPATPAGEEGAGKGIDHRTGSGCDFNTFMADGLYQNFWWRQKFYHTSVKAQGRRGACVAFALTAALEGRIAIEKSRWVNLSEQYLWAKIAAEWDPRWFGDGTILANRAEDFHEQGFQLPMEQVWNYNQSQSRVGDEDEEKYSKSCVDYDEYCSNSSHQRKHVCTSVGNQTYCGYQSQGPSGERFKETEPDTIFDWYNDAFGVPVDEMKLLLKQGHPMVAGLLVNTGWDNPNSAGYITTLSDASYRGRHAVQIVGFVSQNDIINHPTLPQAIKTQAMFSGGGYFIIKNSWGYCYGDAGYVYVPVSWAKEYFTTVTVFDVSPSAEFKDTPTPPTVTISKPASGGNADITDNVSLEASASDPNGGCCTFAWTSDKEGNLGGSSSLVHNFSQLGTHTLTVTATDTSGLSASKSIQFTLTNKPPTAQILEPPSGTVYQGATVAFKGKGFDQGNDFPFELPCTSLSWKSSHAGDSLGSGCEFSASFASTGSRTITLTATDAYGAKGTATVTLSVQPLPPSGPPVVNITNPDEGVQYDANANIRLSYTMSDPGGTQGSQYTVVWKIKVGNNTQTITPKTCTIANIPFPCFTPADYGFNNNGVKISDLSLFVTDPEGLTGTDKVQILIGQVP